MAPRRFSTWKDSPPARWARTAAWRAKLLADRHSARAGILMYHRVADEPCDPWGLSVTPQMFDDHMAILAERRAAVDLAALVGKDARDHVRGNGGQVAVTFDDGYVDNIETALPILERHGIPATIFVIPGTLGRRREFWWDALAQAILFSDVLPPLLEIRLGGRDLRYAIDDCAADAAAARAWRAEEEDPRSRRETLYLELWEEIAGLTLEEQDDAVDHLLEWAGMPPAEAPSRLPATAEQFARLADHPLVRIGSHTRHHRMLTRLDPAAQRTAIVQGHRDMETIMGGPIDRFSYPFGRYDASASALVAELGVVAACTSQPTVVTRRSDPRALPRLTVFARDGQDLPRWLGGTFRLLDS